MPERSLYVVSAGGLGREVFMAARMSAASTVAGSTDENPCTFNAGDVLQAAGFLDDRSGILAGTSLANVTVAGSPWHYQPREQDRFLVAIGQPAERQRFAEHLASRGARFARLATTGSRIMTSAEHIGHGTFFDHYALVSCDVQIGQHSYIGGHSTIGHDSRIGDYCQIGAFVFIAGNVTIGSGVTIRSHATINQGVVIEDGATVGPNSAVLRNVGAGRTVFGVPARVVST